MVPSNRSRGNVHTLEHKRFILNAFTMTVVKNQHRLLWTFATSPSWEIFKSCLHALLGKLVLGNPFSAGRFNQVIFRVSAIL